jgi:hypothetical protein
MKKVIRVKELELCGQVHICLERSKTAYREYLEGGKTFLFAKILKIYNEKIRELLLEKGWLLSGSLQKDALALVSHYDIWLQKWNNLYEHLGPQPEDEFVFPNEFIFPKQAAKNLEKEYLRLKQQTTDAK